MTHSLDVLAAGDLQVRFVQRGDRIAHEIWLARTSGDWMLMLSSVEGTADEWWPPSPPLQSYHCEPRPAGPIGLLVGMAGKSHWSASVETKLAEHAVGFELAVRVRTAEDLWVGSSYELGAGVVVAEESRARVVLGTRELAASIVCGAGTTLGAFGSRVLQFVPQPQDDRKTPVTLRWNYQVRRESPRPA